MNWLNLLWPFTSNIPASVVDDNEFTVAVAESVTAGALSNALCAEPGSSRFFKGGIVTYSIQSKKEILNVDIEYSEKNNFANVFTTSEMARSVVKIFNSRIGLATTGYSLPMQREENKELNQCALNIKHPYAYICLYDSQNNKDIIREINFTYDEHQSPKMQRAMVQTKVSIEGLNLYNEYKQANCKKII